ncbi:hypothetical protein E6C76_03875 [Pseudothauera nasutitermitis]|uniref:Uncharacterized protein n=1 Tax=Pseudothauera nasutitermitis TaxID=2565930 RepID=A0A4S4B477_9RHOO|nr:hypothetical protein [Pseudothauera nasutitermitis]THF67508.1 hypothetical protein E6C76_03875 [Pseudothauera nasutitermitis]
MTTKKPKTPPTDEQIQDSVRLRELFEKRAGMSQLEFGQVYGIGNQGMVWQYLNADKPKGSVLNVVAAIKFAEGLRCHVSDFSPSLQKEIDRIAMFASDRRPAAGTGAGQDQQTNLASQDSDEGDVIVKAKERAKEFERNKARDAAIIEKMIDVGHRYQVAEPPKQLVIDFLLKDESAPGPPWADGDARSYADSLEMKALRWIAKGKSDAQTKTGT